MKTFLTYFLAIAIGALGLLTLFLSTSVIFDLFDMRAKEGNYVMFVVIANFIASFMYLVAAYGFFQRKDWTAKLLGVSWIVITAAFVGLLVHINSSGIYEEETVKGMIVRIILTFLFTLSAYLLFNTKRLK